jgi:hypothetical protein
VQCFRQFNTKPDKEGHYFIDRNPTMFPYIISYLRDPKNVPNFKRIEKEDIMKELADEVEFYQIQSLRALMEKERGGSSQTVEFVSVIGTGGEF